MVKASIDKMSIIFDCPSFSSGGKFAVKFWESFRKCILNRSSYERTDMFYKYNATYNDIFISWGMNEHGVDDKMRLEFNPSKTKVFDIISVIVFIGQNSLLSARVTRLDFAVDYDFELSAVSFYDKFKRKCQIICGDTGVQTIYLGAKSSDVQIRIYDKRVQLKEEFNTVHDGSWWRVESQDQRPFSLFGELNKNPFQNLFYVDIFDIEGLDDFEMLFVTVAAKLGVNGALSIVRDRNNRQVKLARVLSRRIQIETPEEVYRKNFEPLITKLKEKLNDGSICKLH